MTQTPAERNAQERQAVASRHPTPQQLEEESRDREYRAEQEKVVRSRQMQTAGQRAVSYIRARIAAARSAPRQPAASSKPVTRAEVQRMIRQKQKRAPSKKPLAWGEPAPSARAVDPFAFSKHVLSSKGKKKKRNPFW